MKIITERNYVSLNNKKITLHKWTAAILFGLVSTSMANAADQNLLGSSAPQLVNNSDGKNVNYELGTRFSASVNGQISAIRFYKSSKEASSKHLGKIYSSSGALLASVEFKKETSSGWQVQRLTTPLSISANAIYVVTVNTGGSYYVASNNGFANQIVSGNLKSAASNPGVYGPVGKLPTQSYMKSNYFRDVVFVAASPTPTPQPTVTPSPTPTPSPTVTPTPSPNPTPPTNAQCPKGSAYADGCANAPAGVAQHPTLLNEYSIKPEWNVAGVDYHVGVPDGKVLKDWQILMTNPPAGLEWDSRGYFRCNSGNISLDGYDFTTGRTVASFYQPSGGCASLSITNSKIGCYPALGNGQNAPGFGGINLQGSMKFTFKYNTMDFTNCQGTGANGIITVGAYGCSSTAAGCTMDVQYNYIRNLFNTFLGFYGHYTSFVHRYNMIISPATSSPGDPAQVHMNSMSGLGSGSYSPDYSFNVTFNAQTYAGGELPQFYYNGGGTIINPKITNNVFPYNAGGASYIIHGNGAYTPVTTLVGTGTFKDNYFDTRNTFGAIYPNSLTGWTSSGNKNMVTGAAVNP